MQVFSPNVHGQARPEQIKPGETLLNVTFIKSGEKLIHHPIQLRMVIHKQSIHSVIS